MKAKLLVASVIIAGFAACSKDKYNTKPRIEFVSVNSEIIPVNINMLLTLEFFDKEGDISDTLTIIKKRINQLPTTTLRDTLRFSIPKVKSYRNGTFEVNLDYENHLKSAAIEYNPARHDTLMFKVFMKDKDKNVSDTLNLGPYVIMR